MAAQDLCALSDVRLALEMPASDTSRDTLISALITQASEAIMNEVDREFAPATASATRRFRVDGWLLNLAPYDLRTVATFTLNPESSSPLTLTAGTDYNLLPVGSPSGTYTSVEFSRLLTGLYSTTAFSYGHALCDISGAWGFASVPEPVKRAAVVTVGSWLRKDISALIASGELDVDGGIVPSFPATYGIPNVVTNDLLGSFYRLSSQVAV